MSNELTPKEVEDYGEEFLHVVGKKARASVGADIAQLQQGVAQVQQTLHAERRKQMLAQLDAQLPGWRSQNTSPGFLSWLAETDMFTGRTRNALLQEAWASNLADRVIAIFRGYRGAGQALEGQTHPAGNTGGSASSGHSRDWPTTGKPIITARQIQNYHHDVARGLYEHRPADKQALDRANSGKAHAPTGLFWRPGGPL
jgi:hypothetical protein